MAKPSTAFALSIGIACALMISRKLSMKLLAISIVCACFLVFSSALAIDRSLFLFIERFRTGIEFAAYLGGGHSLGEIFRLDNFKLNHRETLAITFLAISSFLAARSTSSARTAAKLFSFLISLVFFIAVVVLAIVWVDETAGFGHFQGMVVWGIVLSMVALGLTSGPRRPLMSDSVPYWGMAVLFFLMPYTFAFGTIGNYWRVGSSASIFWVFGGLVMMGPLIRSQKNLIFALPLVLATQAVTAALLQTGLERPYRQPQPIRNNDTPMKFGASGSELMLSAGFAKYVSEANAVAQRAGLQANTPVIDLTGQSPGILYALNAESIGQAWTIGGYPGSAKLAIAALERVSCEKIAAAWLLWEPNGQRSLPAEVMQSLGADFPTNYRQMGAWETADGAGGRKQRIQQILLAPAAPTETLSACLTIRKTKSK